MRKGLRVQCMGSRVWCSSKASLAGRGWQGARRLAWGGPPALAPALGEASRHCAQYEHCVRQRAGAFAHRPWLQVVLAAGRRARVCVRLSLWPRVCVCARVCVCLSLSPGEVIHGEVIHGGRGHPWRGHLRLKVARLARDSGVNNQGTILRCPSLSPTLTR